MNLQKIQDELETKVDLEEAINSLKTRFANRHTAEKPTSNNFIVFYSRARALSIVTMEVVGIGDPERDTYLAYARSFMPFRAVVHPTAILAQSFELGPATYVLSCTVITPIGTVTLNFPYRFGEGLEWYTTDVTVPEADAVIERIMIFAVGTIPYFSLSTILSMLAARGAEVQYLTPREKLNDYIYTYVPGDEQL